MEGKEKDKEQGPRRGQPVKDDFAKCSPSIKIVVWIDANVNSSENRRTIKKMEEKIPGVIVHPAKSLQEGIEILKKYTLRLVYVIVSGSLCEDYMDQYEKNLRQLYVITANIIYCGNKKYHDYKKFAYDKFFNPGGIATKASEVISFIQEGEIPYGKVDSDTSAKSKALTNDYGFSFSEVKGLPQLAKPCMLGKFITDKVITEKNYNAFLKQIAKYGHPQLTYYSNPTGTLDVKLPYYLNSLFWLKLYSLQSPFYGDVNKDLTHQGTADLSVYDPFIFSMYMGLKEGYLESYRGELFRGSLMAKEELESLKERLKKVKETKITNEDEIAVTVCTANCFLSFSKSEEVADDFIKQYKPSGNLTQVKFIINAISPKNKSYFVSNVVIGGLSTYAYEEEVLVLPFSCFEVVEIIPGKVTTIVLDQLYKKERKIKEYIKWKGKAEVMKFLAGSGESVINSGAVKECSSADFFNKKIILWIDQFANCKKYDDELKKHEKELAEYQVIRVNSVDKGFNVLKMHENKLSYVILSQYLAKEFYLRYEDEALDNRLITANIVLCENNFKDLKEKYKKTFEEDGFLNDPYGNPGGFVETFDEALAYIKKDERDLKKPEKPKGDFEIADSYDTTFILDEGENIREGYFDIYKNKKGKPNEKVIQEDLKKFRYFIEKAYGKSKKPEVKELVNLADPTEEKNIPIPAELYATNFMKMYVSNGLDVNDPENFFTNMNMDLTQDDEDKILRYLPYIYTIYLGVEAGMVKNWNEALFRAGCLTDKEIDKLQKKLQKKNPLLVWPKPFLTFYKTEKAADDFLNTYELGNRAENCSKVKFILEKPKEGIFINNMDTGKFARFKENQEVVTLPFTPFLIKEIKEETGSGMGNDYYAITMAYDNVEKPSLCSGSGERNRGDDSEDSVDEDRK